MSLGLTKQEFETLDKRLSDITSKAVEEIEIDFNNPPTIEQLSDSNKSYSINCAILFIDIRKSTDLSDASHAKSMVKIYRSFMRMCVECVRKNGGVTRQFLGDRIMGVFMDEKDENGNVTVSSVDKAIYCARSMQTVLDFSLNKHIYKNINKKIIECGIGISYGKVLVTQVGMRGVENDDEKENEKNVVWVGKITNHASKYSDLTKSGEVFISKDTYNKISFNLKADGIWKFATRSKSNRTYEGYVAENFYLDNKVEFGDVIKKEGSKDENIAENHLANGIEKVDKLIDKLLKKEYELFKKESELIQKQIEIEKHKQINKTKSSLIYSDLKNFLSDIWLKNDAIVKLGYEFWIKYIENVFEIGKLAGKSELEIKKDVDFYLINIYCNLKMYELAHEYLIIQARYSSYISCEYKNVIPKVRNKYLMQTVIEGRLKEIKDIEERKRFEGYYEDIKNIKKI
ncbi:adenylate/guanylate cyclase domain-containing protein [Paraclostridium sordellii]|uniref:adenylate/guanylate cyclase domain-containing protein n=1 Tax=Paraclostridium sordellii TaxID=1505 RepID=UPI0005E0837E|nr:adenylate/guanylate cyclase domain-containing protein [Paeniclostridium sordellii]CEN94263.1 Predicted transmembrane sensor domain [[Clostridium] sordellii] [Paeniclostridium sordellii]CEN94713.1 Predicted transmembrane sensor domain [[Clostridium] sordellii] [Paeniclostridium sordellii]